MYVAQNYLFYHSFMNISCFPVLISYIYIYIYICRYEWPRVLSRRSAAARLLRSWVRIPPGAWMFVCCECCVLSGRGLCDELITRPEESYRLWCVVVYDLETSRIVAPYMYDISNLRVKPVPVATRSKAAHLLRLCVRNPGAWIFVCC